MTNAAQPRTWVRAINTAFAVALAVFVLANYWPIANQHVLAAVVLYGAHSNHTLLDPDEIELLHALAKAAATSHSQVRIAMLQREVAALSRKTEGLEREKETQQKMIERFEALVQTRMTAAGEGT